MSADVREVAVPLRDQEVGIQGFSGALRKEFTEDGIRVV